MHISLGMKMTCAHLNGLGTFKVGCLTLLIILYTAQTMKWFKDWTELDQYHEEARFRCDSFKKVAVHSRTKGSRTKRLRWFRCNS